MELFSKVKELIEFENIILKRRSHDYNKQIFSALEDNREFLREYLFWVDNEKTLSDVKNSTDFFINLWNDKKDFAYMIIDELIGIIGIQNINIKDNITEIGYWLRADKTGCGYISTALKYIEELASINKTHRLEIKCDAKNFASSTVATRNGYKFESVRVEAINSYGIYKDEEVYVKFLNTHCNIC